MIRPEDVTILKKSGAKGFKENDDSRIALLMRRMIAVALEQRATDLHLEPDAGLIRVRARVDGFLREIQHLDGDTGKHLVSALKVLCDMDISGRKPMQDGSFTAIVTGMPVEFRVATLEEVGGEKIAIRILDTQPETQELGKLGLDPRAEADLRTFLARSQGMLLVSGPTGSGKSTTLHAMLRSLDRQRRNVIAIEDPVEARIDYVTHVAVNAKLGLSFASALRNALRHDPNVLMIGEIRDAETAEIAFQSGLTGHLVFSTVHARDAMGALGRLSDLGLAPARIAEVLNFSLAQRLVRCLCEKCRRPMTAAALKESPLGKMVKGQAYEAAGCETCDGTGYRGRIGIFELVRMGDRIRQIVADKRPEAELRKAAQAEGAVPILVTAMEKVNAGITSIEEVERVLG